MPSSRKFLYKRAVGISVGLLILLALALLVFKPNTPLADATGLAKPAKTNAENNQSQVKVTLKAVQDKSKAISTAPEDFAISDADYFPNEVKIKLGNHETIERTFTKPSLFTLPPMTEDNTENFMANLEALANEGVAGAALRKFNLLGECANATRDEISYRIRESGILSGEVSIPGMSMEDMITANRMTYLLCKEISNSDIESADKWFKLALENGSHFARQQHAKSFLATDIAEAGRQYKILWDQGYANSGSSLAFIYRNTDFDGPDPSQPNMVKSYAFQLAQDLVNIAGLEQSGQSDAVLRITDITNAQEIAKSTLTLQEQQDAEQLAKDLVKNNENCCVWFW